MNHDTHDNTSQRLRANDSQLSPGFCSWVSHPRRNPRWGNASYRGNCDGTLFKDLVRWYSPESVADPMVGSGTTRDVLKDLAGERLCSGDHWAGDLREGFDLLHDSMPGRYDLVWVHPPYWNIIRYSDHPSDLSNMDDFEVYREALTASLRKCAERLRHRGRLAVLIGDVRRRGRYYCLAKEVMGLSGLVGDLKSVIIKAQHNCASDGRRYARMTEPAIKHEYCLVFERA